MDDQTKRIMVLSTPKDNNNGVNGGDAVSDSGSINVKVRATENTPLIESKKEVSYLMMIWAVILMLSSGFFLSVCAAIIKWGSDLNFSSMEMLMWRSGMQCVIAVISSVVTLKAKQEWQQFKSLTKFEIIFLICRGLSGGIGVACYFHAITLIPVGDAITGKIMYINIYNNRYIIYDDLIIT